jgi:predicted CoA-binding protein
VANERVSLETIDDFLTQKRIAMAGISPDPANFSVQLFQELCRRGYDVVPVNLNTPECRDQVASLACRTFSLQSTRRRGCGEV